MEKRKFDVRCEDIDGDSKAVFADTRSEAEKLAELSRRYNYRNIRIIENLLD